MWSNPLCITTTKRTLTFKNECDYRVILTAIKILNDPDLLEHDKYSCLCECVFKEKVEPSEYGEVIPAVYQIIDTTYGDEYVPSSKGEKNAPKLMDWEKDFRYIAPPISRVLGYDVRSSRVTHWYAFVGAYMEIGSCFFSEIVAIRRKLAYHEPLDESDRKFYSENHSIINMDESSPFDDEFLKGGF